MSRQADISGTVTDESGAPLENAEVYLFREDLAGSGGIVVATTTDSVGNYQFTSHPDQTGNVEDWHLGYKYNASDDKFFASNWGVSSPLGAESNFAVAVDSTTSPVAPGNTLDVTATVTETGGFTDTQTITLSINNGVGTEDTRSVSLPVGNSDTITLSWAVPSSQTEQDYTATVASEDDTASQTVTVGGGEFLLTLDSLTFVEPATFDVGVASTTSPVKPGNTLDVTADITNTGDETDAQNITLDIDNGVGQVDKQSVTLAGGGSTAQTLSWSVPSGQTEQDYTATVSSADDSASQTVTVSNASPSPVSHWTFDTADTNSGTAVDVVGSNNGTIQGATTGVSGANQTYTTNEAYSFDGTDDSVEIPGTPDFSGQAFALAVWVRPDNLNNTGNIIGQDKLGANARNQRIMTNNGTIETRVFNGNSNKTATIPSSKVSTGSWYHITGVFNHATGETKIYLNGSLEDTTNFGSSKDPGLTDIQVGKSDGGPNHYTGDVDDARLYSKELTSTEVSNLYNNGRI